MQRQRDGSERDGTGWETLTSEVAGASCAYCDDGELVRGAYKGSPAMVCPDCETPALQRYERDS